MKKIINESPNERATKNNIKRQILEASKPVFIILACKAEFTLGK